MHGSGHDIHHLQVGQQGIENFTTPKSNSEFVQLFPFACYFTRSFHWSSNIDLNCWCMGALQEQLLVTWVLFWNSILESTSRPHSLVREHCSGPMVGCLHPCTFVRIISSQKLHRHLQNSSSPGNLRMCCTFSGKYQMTIWYRFESHRSFPKSMFFPLLKP